MKMLGLDEFSNDVTRKLEAEAKITKPLPRIPAAKGGLMDELKSSIEKRRAPAEATSKMPEWGIRKPDEEPAKTPSHKGEILRSLKQPGAIGSK